MFVEKREPLVDGKTGEREMEGKETYVGGIDNLIGRRVGKDGLCMDTGLVGKGAETGNVVVERDGNLDGVGDQVFNLSKHVQVVLALNVFRVGNHHSSDKTTERGNTVSLSDTEDRGINVRGTGFQGGVGVGDGTTSVVVEMTFNVTRDNATQGSDEVVYLTRISATDGISDTDSVEADLVDGSVDGEQVDEFGSERVFRRESNLDTLGLDEFNDLDSPKSGLVTVDSEASAPLTAW